MMKGKEIGIERLHQDLYMFDLTTWPTLVPNNLFLRVSLINFLRF